MSAQTASIIGTEKTNLKTSTDLDEKLRTQLVKDYTPLVSYIARKIFKRLPSSVDIDDLISSGYIGLLEAIDKYDPSMGCKFKTYSAWRIRGAILDELRHLDLVPRSVRDKIKNAQRVEQKLEQKLKRKPNESELSSALNMDYLAYHKFIQDYAPPVEISFSRYSQNGENAGSYELADPKTFHSIEDKLVHRNNLNDMKFFLKTLPKNQQMVLNLYYFYKLNLKECAVIMGLSESRISQIRTTALNRMKKKLDQAKIDWELKIS